jgi:hypothetical protein
MRLAKFMILSGTNGTGKSTVQKQLTKVNKRNLIIPANPYDKAWNKLPKIKAQYKFVPDPKDPKGKKQILRWYLPNMNKYSGTKVLDTSLMVEMDEEPRKIFRYICLYFVNGGLFVDDYKNYIHASGILPNYVTRLFRDRRHRGVDIFMASHSLQDINGEFLQFDPELLIFRVTRPINKTVRDKIENSRELDKIIARVKQKSKTDPYYCERFRPNTE